MLIIGAGFGATYFFLNYEIQTQHENGRAVGWRIVAKTAGQAPAGEPAPGVAPVARPTLRIASFHLGRFDETKLANRRVSDLLLHLLSRFDLIALQGVRGKNQGVLIHLVERINAATGRTFDFATCATQQRDGLEHYNAFLFDRARVEVDRTKVQFVEDYLGRFRVKPLVGMFRARGPDANEAFTFALIGVETDRDQTARELDLLAEAYRAVRRMWPAEDDVILLGDLESDDQHLGQLGQLLGVGPLLSGVPTTTRGTHLLDNILLDRRATREFTGRVEVVDLMREFDLTMPQALEVSEHLPIWAEFSVYEGGEAGHVSPRGN